MTPAVVCQLDHLVVSATGLFGFGWAVPQTTRITAAWLDLHFAADPSRRVAASINRPREDVAAAFPDNPAATHAGFMLLAGWPRDPPTAATLHFETAAGDQETVALDLPPPETPRTEAGIGWRYLARRAWAHLRLGRLRSGLAKYRDLRQRIRAGVRTVAEADLTAAVGDRPVILIVDHAMGGGANAYRDRVLAELAAAGTAVLLLTFTVSALRASLELYAPGRPPQAVRCESLVAVRKVLDRTQLSRLIYNCGVSFPRGLELCDLIRDLANRPHASLDVVIHDYYTVCPSAFLLDAAGRFCGVPEAPRCRECLPAQTDGFVSLAGCDSIDAWRDAWGGLLRQAAGIRCFSESSRRLLIRAYPDLLSQIAVVPHAVPPLPRLARPARRPGDPLVIGVIGSISHHKGAAVVANLAEAIVTTAVPARIVVIGQVEAACPPEVVHQTGGYARADLPRLVTAHGVDLVLLPSICPETFSFVAHETLAMGLPLVTLDLGAPADLARAHPLGHVADSTAGTDLLANLLAFADSLAAAPREASA
jgi:glycosyltransferase involved in cell wall biosynthesis